MVGKQAWGRCGLCGWGSGVTQNRTCPVSSTSAWGASLVCVPLALTLPGSIETCFLINGSPGEPRQVPSRCRHALGEPLGSWDGAG